MMAHRSGAAVEVVDAVLSRGKKLYSRTRSVVYVKGSEYSSCSFKAFGNVAGGAQLREHQCNHFFVRTFKDIIASVAAAEYSTVSI